MPLDKEKQGLDLIDYKKQLPDTTYAMRVGKEVPEGSVNLAYIHTPKVQAEENISLIDTTYTSDNVIPQDQLESMAVANAQGQLEYVDLIGNEEVRTRPPGNTFPSNKVSITRQFKKGEALTENALYYKFEIDYHYDSKTATPNAAGEYIAERYTGQQIELTDENGNLLDDTHKYEIYVQAQEENPRIYAVRIYLHKNTTEEETIKVRYNHIDHVVIDAQVQSVQRSIEFYSNKDNTLSLNGLTKQMLEGGKLRIINGRSSFEEMTQEDVISADMEQEIFAVIPKSDGSGYQLIVPQRSESDPRVPQTFTHRVVATYTDYTGQEVKVSVGSIADWVINPEALLKNEREDYSGEWKNIGIPTSGARMNAKNMIELSLPFGTPSIPSDAVYSIEDGQGNLLYTVQEMTDNAGVDTQVNELMSKSIEAKSNGVQQLPWKNAMLDNTVVKQVSIPHRATIIPERQKTRWEFSWKANGQGYTEQNLVYKTSWQVAARAAFRKSQQPQLLDLLDNSKWEVIGLNENGTGDSLVAKSDWLYTYVPSMGKTVLSFQKNPADIVGFHQKQETIDGQVVDMTLKEDYEFSVRVKMEDPIDDDAIGVMFRVRNSRSYYGFFWESNDIKTQELTYTSSMGDGSLAGTSNGVGRIHLDEYGLTTKHYSPTGNAVENWKWTNSLSKHKAAGFGSQHKKIFKATPSSYPASAETSAASTSWDGSTRYPSDRTGCAFEEITTKDSLYTSTAGKKGWEYGREYKITVSVTGDLFRVYINDNPDSEEKGTLVCQGRDDEHQQGSYGIFTVSQRWTYWYDLKLTEIEMEKIYSEQKDITLTDHSRKKLSNYMAKDILAPLLDSRTKEAYKGAPYEVFEYSGESTGDLNVVIDPNDGFVYGQTSNSAAGSKLQNLWSSDDHGLTVEGKGFLEYHSDGHFTIYTDPAVLPTSHVPEGVKAYVWNEPWITAGENVTIKLKGTDGLEVAASIPPIELTGQPYTLPEDQILKTENLKHLQNLFGKDGFYSALNIPSDIPQDEILLRIERGEITGISPNGSATIVNADHRVNYRFRLQKDGFTRLPVDQFQDQLGVNRLRLKDLLTADGEINPDIQTDVVGWTTFQEMESVPLFAVKVEEDRKIEIEKPKVEVKNMELDNWYLRVKNGRFLKRVILPYHESASTEKLPEIYVAYPELLGMVGKPEDIVEVDLEYHIPEYTNQEFHNRPHVFIDKEVPVVLGEYAIQTRHAPLVLKSESGKSFLTVYSLRGNQRRALRVADIDAVKGIIYLHDRIREQDDVYVNYAYSEDWFTYRGFYKEIIEEPAAAVASFRPKVDECDLAFEKSVVTGYTFVETEKVRATFSNTSGILDYYWALPSFIEPIDYSDAANNHIEFAFIKRTQGKYGGTFTVKFNDGQICKTSIQVDVTDRECDLTFDKEIVRSNVGFESERVIATSSINTSGIESYTFPVPGDIEVIDYSRPEEGHLEFAFIKPTEGLERLHFRVTYKDGQTCSTGIDIDANYPICDLTLTPEVADVLTGATTMPFIGTYSSNLSGIASYNWSFHETDLEMIDASNIATGHLEATFRALAAGEHTIILSVTYNDGQYCTDSSKVYVSRPECDMSLTIENDTFDVESGSIVHALHSNTSGVASFKWSMTTGIEKGLIVSSDALSVIGKTEGVKMVHLTVTYVDGQSCQASISLTVNPPPVIRREFFHLDLNPTAGHRHTVAHNGFHQWIPIDIDQEVFEIPEEENSSSELLVKQIHVYLRPNVIRYVDQVNPVIHGKPVPGTMRNEVLFHTDEEWWFNPKDYKYDQSMFRLGKVMLQANSNIQENMTILDTRTRGGGLDETLSKEIIRQVNEESLHHWDIGYFDGEAYQENGVVVIKVPRNILVSDSNPTGFHETEVQEAVAKHKAFGVLPIIEYYDEVADTDRFNLIPNPDFTDGKSIGYFDPVRTTGSYELMRSPFGGEASHVMMLTDDSVYAITLPGHLFDDEQQYQIKMRAIKEQTATHRSAGTVEVFYRDGSQSVFQLGHINQAQWSVYAEYLEIKENVHHVTVKLNEAPETRTGRILFDYVKLQASPILSPETTEVHEI